MRGGREASSARTGFSLIEVLITIVLIGILTAFLTPRIATTMFSIASSLSLSTGGSRLSARAARAGTCNRC